jgi:mannitol-specific phosphotransferase system IIBC component
MWLWLPAITEQGCEGLVAALDPAQVDAFIKALSAMNAIHPSIGIAVAVIGLITASLTLINNFRTKRNTQANKETATLLAQHKEEMNRLKDEAVRDVKELTTDLKASVDFARVQFSEEARNFKLGAMKLNEQNAQKLSMIPRLQDAIDQIDKRSLDTAFKAAQTESKVAEILDILKRAKGGR